MMVLTIPRKTLSQERRGPGTLFCSCWANWHPLLLSQANIIAIKAITELNSVSSSSVELCSKVFTVLWVRDKKQVPKEKNMIPCSMVFPQGINPDPAPCIASILGISINKKPFLYLCKLLFLVCASTHEMEVFP